MVDRASPKYGEDIKQTYINRISRFDVDVSLRAWPHILKNGEKVTMLWEGISNPKAKDFIAYYCPVYGDPSHHLDYITVDHSPTWQKGYGHITVTLYNMRTTCVFKYYRAGNSYNQLAGTSNEISFSDGGTEAPLQGHIAMTGLSTEMRVMWTSGEGNFVYILKHTTDMPLFRLGPEFRPERFITLISSGSNFCFSQQSCLEFRQY